MAPSLSQPAAAQEVAGGRDLAVVRAKYPIVEYESRIAIFGNDMQFFSNRLSLASGRLARRLQTWEGISNRLLYSRARLFNRCYHGGEDEIQGTAYLLVHFCRDAGRANDPRNHQEVPLIRHDPASCLS